jgi:hypothetical protein
VSKVMAWIRQKIAESAKEFLARRGRSLRPWAGC